MSDPQRVTRSDLLPPPAPPLPPARQVSASSRPGVLQRLVAPLGFGFASRPNDSQDYRTGNQHGRGGAGELGAYTSPHEETKSYRTGVPISALDISPKKTHAVLAGRELLKTIRVDDGNVYEDFDLRSSISSYGSTRSSSSRRDFLPVNDVKWSHTEHDTTIATAANNGRIVLYDLTKPEVELARLHEHDRQVHKLAFSPFSGAKLLSGSQDGTLRLWDLRLLDGERGALTMRSQHTFQGRAEAIRDVKWSLADGFDFAFCTDSGSVQLWDFRYPMKVKARINAHDKPCFALDWHPDGKHIATGGLDKEVKIWDLSNPDRRQKPSFVLRAPQAVMKLQWRPACWSWEMQESGDWQSTQLVTSYNHEDSRIHLWDLRRQHIPFREIDRYAGPPSDLVWNSKDLLWTVGNEGHFLQTDMKYAQQVVDQLNPCHISFTPDGSFVKVSEKRTSRAFNLQEANDTFLNQKRHLDEKSRSWEDEEPSHDGYSFRRRQTKSGQRFPKSQGNTPPSRDERTLAVSLERSLRKGGPFQNRQIGLIQEITGASLNGAAFRYLAQNYARPLIDLERKQHPEQILDHLEAAFKQNSQASAEVSMYRLAQTWKILGTVLIPELASWAEANRKKRLEARPKDIIPAEAETKNIIHPDTVASPLQVPIRSDDDLAGKIKNRVFKSVLHESTKGHSEPPSNMSTPLAKPLPDSPISMRDPNSRHVNLVDPIDSIPPLPEALLSSHNAAAAAASSLRISSSPTESNTTDSPEKLYPPASNQPMGSYISPKTKPADVRDMQRSPPKAIIPSPRWQRANVTTEQDRRAALRDYRAQSRPLLNFESPISADSPRPGPPNRHDSNESFTMFSTSTASSHRAKSIGHSLESAVQLPPLKSSVTPEWKDIGPTSPHTHISCDQSTDSRGGLQSLQRTSTLSDFTMDGDGEEQGSAESMGPIMQDSQNDSSLSVSPFGRPTEETLPFEFEPTSFPFKSENPTVPRTSLPETRHSISKKQSSDLSANVDAFSQDFIYTDFRPITLTDMDDKVQSVWDTFSLLAAAMEFDLTASHDNSTCQFTAHLLMHITPFFDVFSPITGQDTHSTVLSTFESRLKVPTYARRIAESALSSYHQFLLSHELYTQAAEVKKVAYDASYHISHTEGPSLAQELRILLTCGHCGSPLGGQNVGVNCLECNQSREPCSICLCNDLPSEIGTLTEGHSMWTTCLGCGHGGHFDCLSEWFADLDSEGSCPTPGCWHDCGPGSIRQNRLVLQQSLWEQEGKGMKLGINIPPTRKDSWVVGPSPAVGRTRRVLRESSFAKKQVRLLTPGEMGGVALSSSH